MIPKTFRELSLSFLSQLSSRRLIVAIAILTAALIGLLTKALTSGDFVKCAGITGGMFAIAQTKDVIGALKGAPCPDSKKGDPEL